VVIEHTPLEDELGDVLDKAMRQAGLNDHDLAQRAQVSAEKIRDAIDYRSTLDLDELRRLADALCLNELGLAALAQGRYPLPEISGLPFCLYPLRTPHGIGVANAYVVADCALASGILFDTGVDYALLRRVWPKNVRTIEAVFITHAETEHIGGLKEAQAAFGRVPVFAPEGAGIEGAVAVNEGAKLAIGGFEVAALRTPGHVEAHNCYVVRVPRVRTATPLLVSGDLLFAGSAGGAYYCKDRLAMHLRRILTELPDSTVVAPGHGPLTTLRHEKRFNPFIR
jgi:hydroxyacylglutathione hydrolase